MAALDEGILASVINANFKTLADQVAVNVAASQQNAVAHQNRLNMIAEASIGQVLKGMNEMDPAEAVAVSAVIKSDLAPLLAALNGTIASMQQAMKGAQTTLPETGGKP